MTGTPKDILKEVAYLLVREQLPFDTVAKLFECASLRAAQGPRSLDKPFGHLEMACRMLAQEAVKTASALTSAPSVEEELLP